MIFRILLLPGLLFLPGLVGNGQEFGEIQQAWKTRAITLKTWRIEFESQEYLESPLPSPHIGKGGEIAAYKNLASMVFVNGTDGKYRLEYDSEAKNWFEVFDGSVVKRYGSNPDTGYPSGEIRVDQKIQLRLDMLPVILGFDPLEPRLGLNDLNKSGTAFLEDTECVVYSNTNYELWVPVQSKTFPVRYIDKTEGRGQIDVQIRYETNADSVTTPKSWIINFYGANNAIVKRIEGKVHQVQINPELPADTFDLEFPVNAWVSDYTSGKPVHFIQRSDKSKRIIRPGEFDGTNYEELLVDKPVGWLQRSRFWLIGTGILLLGLAALTMFRKKSA